MLTPKAKAQAKVIELIEPAAQTLAKALKENVFAFEKGAQSVVWSKQVDLALRILEVCAEMSGDEQKDQRSAARILATVGGDAVTRELAKRYALKQRMTERARIVAAVPAHAEHTPAADSSDAADAHARPHLYKESEAGIACEPSANDMVSRDTDTCNDNDTPDGTAPDVEG